MRRLLLFLTVLLALLGAACGGGDSGTDVASDKTGEEAGKADDGSGGKSFSGKGSGDFCDKARKLTAEFDERDDADTPEEFKRFFEDVIDAIEDLQDEAPSEIKADLTKALDYFKRTNEVFKKYDYDFEKIGQAPEAKALDDTEANEANERVDDYFEQVCKIDSDDDGDTSGSDGSSDSTVTDDTAADDTSTDDTTGE